MASTTSAPIVRPQAGWYDGVARVLGSFLTGAFYRTFLE